MSEQPITLSVLRRFHEEVLLPDVRRIVADSELRLRDEMHALHDSLLVRLDRLETEYEAIKVGLRRVEERLDSLEAQHRELAAEVRRLDERLSRVEKRLDDLVATQQRYALQSEVQDLRARLDVVEAQIAVLQRPKP
jgi:predicted  nucleic acid-binding Zn-ribbon protein